MLMLKHRHLPYLQYTSKIGIIFSIVHLVGGTITKISVYDSVFGLLGGMAYCPPGLFGRAMAPKILFSRVQLQCRVQSSPESRSSPGNSAPPPPPPPPPPVNNHFPGCAESVCHMISIAMKVAFKITVAS